MRFGLTEVNNEIMENILEAVGETMESLIFSEVEPADPDNEDQALIDPIWSDIDILRPVQGKLTIIMPRELAMEITGDLFGPDLDGPPADSMVRDTLAEIVNTVAGKLMSSIIKHDQVLELGLPVSGEGPVDDSQALVCRMNMNEYDFYLLARGLANIDPV